jgi:poly-gamma-glutamate synthesis protein (capsule biosynthesis protein)
LLIESSDVDLVIGHHAHWVQPLESFDGQWVAYGLGNLMAAHGTVGEELREGLLVRFTFTEDPETGAFVTSTAEYVPVYQTYDAPRMVVDVAAAVEGGETGPESIERLEVAFDRTTEVVGRRGAFDDGMALLGDRS